MPKRELAPLYYLEHFGELLKFMRQHYQPIMRSEHLRFISDFEALPAPAAALFVRVCNRKGLYFRSDRLRYDEFEDIAPLQTTLIDTGFLRTAESRDIDDLLGTLSRIDLVEVRSLLETADVAVSCPRSALKSALLQSIRIALDELRNSETPNAAATAAMLSFASDFVVQLHDTTMRFVLFLYFGQLEDNLSRLAMRDLGLVRTGIAESSYTARFDTASDAWNSFELARLAKQLKSAGDLSFDLLSASRGWLMNLPPPETELGRALFDKCIFRLGGALETLDQSAMAASLYEASDHAQAVEKSIRLWYRLDGERAKSLISATLEHPGSDDAWLFAMDFQARKYAGALAEPQPGQNSPTGNRRTSDLTDLLRAAHVTSLDEAYRHEPEAALARRLARTGARVIHTENRIWRSLFALAFWSQLYESAASRFSSDFQHRPSGLSDGSFYAAQRSEIEAVLQLDKPVLKAKIMSNIARCYGQVNSFTGWTPELGRTVCDLIDHAPLEGLRSVLGRMVQRYDTNSSGFPDLMLVDAEGLRFIEVKAEGDQLRRHQLKQLLKLREAGFRVSIERVHWIIDPEQPYVVVDVETTGGNAQYGRLTEVGAVIVQGGEVTSSYQTLLDPQRRIPANITALTGISQSMVTGAPVFEQIADELRAFIEGNIFVAHNVRFDYGFIQQSYRRMEQSIRLPTLCTCAMMKKLRPGLDSYSLKNLTKAFDIEMTQHHRALSDARAAAELLKIINSMRLAGTH